MICAMLRGDVNAKIDARRVYDVVTMMLRYARDARC